MLSEGGGDQEGHPVSRFNGVLITLQMSPFLCHHPPNVTSQQSYTSWLSLPHREVFNSQNRSPNKPRIAKAFIIKAPSIIVNSLMTFLQNFEMLPCLYCQSYEVQTLTKLLTHEDILNVQGYFLFIN